MLQLFFFLSVNFCFSLFLGIEMYAKEYETKDK